MQGISLAVWSLPELFTACLCWAVWFVGLSLRPVDQHNALVLRSYRLITLAVNLILSSLFLAHSGIVPAGAALWWTYLIVTTLPPIGLRFNRQSRGRGVVLFEVVYLLASAMCAGGLLIAPDAFVGPDRINPFGYPQATSLLPGMILTLVQVIGVAWSVLNQKTSKGTRVSFDIRSLTITWFVYIGAAFLEQLSTSAWVLLPPTFWVGALALALELARLIHAQQSRTVLALSRANTELTRLSTDLEERVESRTQELHQLAMFDPLTGLPNRSHGEQFLSAALTEAERTNQSVAVLMVDLNRFKNINDTAGHPVGDAALFEVAQRFQACTPQGSLLARLGGDEFLLVLKDGEQPARPSTSRTAAPGATHQGGADPNDPHNPHGEPGPNHIRTRAEHVSRELIESLASPVSVGGTEFFLGASIGISLYPQDGQDAAALQRLADIAMYRAKNEALGYRAFDALLDADITERIEIERALRRAIETNPEHAFHLEYQPIVELHTGRIASVEALLRWNDPALTINPTRFIPIAEESGLIVPLGNWVLLEACRQAAQWQREGLPGARISVNVSTHQFERPDFVETVRRILDQSGLSPEHLDLEMLESVLVERFDETASKIAQLRALGVRLALDDFGTGYSSLAYLHHLTFDALKIDRSFTQMLGQVSRPRALVAATLSIAHEFGMYAVAEGVETPAQAAELEILGCLFAQGYLYAKPMPAAQIVTLLRMGALPMRGSVRDSLT
jgi:predicted signal transduction protein with EAL and GGDEF domain